MNSRYSEDIIKHVREWFSKPDRVAVDYYRRANPDVAEAGADPAEHFTAFGLVEGRVPHPDYSPETLAFLLRDCTVHTEVSPLLAYLEKRVPAGATHDILARHVDEALSSVPSLNETEEMSALRDFLDYVTATKLVDEAFYLARNPDIAEAGADPVLHFVLFGHAEGRLPSAAFAAFLKRLNDGAPDGESHDIVSAIAYLRDRGLGGPEVFLQGVPEDLINYALEHKFFDADFYRGKSRKSKQAEEGSLLHFIKKGEAGGRRASALYSKGRLDQFTTYYGRDPDLSPFWNFIRIAKENGFTTWQDACRSLGACCDWITPGRMSVYYRTGAVLAEWKVGASQLPRDKYRFAVFQGRENALTIPFVLDREGADKLVIESVAIGGRKAEVHYVIEDAGGVVRVAHGHQLLENGDADAELALIIPLKSYDFLVGGERYFLKLWRGAKGGPVDIQGANFDAGFHFHREEGWLGLEPEGAQQLPNLRDADTDNVVLWFGAPGRTRSRLAEEYLAEYLEGAEIVSVADLKKPKAFFEAASRAKLAVFDAGRFGQMSEFFDQKVPELAQAFSRAGTLTAGILFADDKPRNIGDFLDISIKLELCKDPADDVAKAENIEQQVWVGAAEWTTNRLKPWLAETEPKPFEAPFTVARLQEACFDLPAQPHVVIISVLYKKAEVVRGFLEAVNRQTYRGPISVVLVDDCSPDDSYDVACRAVEETTETRGERISVHVIRNEENSGNCLSRNRGIEHVKGDIYSVIDCDCLINRDYVAAHVKEHLFGQANVVVGPLNLETHGKPGWEILKELEGSQEAVLARMNMQDDIVREGFVNTITRNLSLRRDWIEAHGGFDPEFSYSAKKNSGFGWEDVELGARIYKSGAHIAFTPDAFSLHQSHGTSVPVERQIVGSATNFNKLFAKHPDIALAARRWSTDTAMRIAQWAKGNEVEHAELTALEQNFDASRKKLAPFLKRWRRPAKRLRVVSLRWHVPHQYEIHKLPFDFTLLTGTGTKFTNEWGYHQRALRPNVRFLPCEEFDPKDYDLCIMHFDENVLCSDLCNGVIGPDWGYSFRWFLENVPLPKVAICHGTPPFKGQYCQNPNEITDFEIHQHEVDRLRHLLRDVMVICNSHQAAAEWQFHKSKVIWHGVDPQEFPPGVHDLDVLSIGSDWNRPHYRGVHMLERILADLEGEFACSSHKHSAAGMPVPEDARFQKLRFRRWVDHVRRHKVYLNTTLRSPMPRSRSEAMMCGVVPVTLNNHDASAFIRQGVNGFYGDTQEELTEYTRFLCANESAREKISAAARMSAMDIFNNDRFLADWMDNLIDMGLLEK